MMGQSPRPRQGMKGEEGVAKAHRVAAIASRFSSLAEIIPAFIKDHRASLARIRQPLLLRLQHSLVEASKNPHLGGLAVPH